MADIVRPIEPFELTQGFGENLATYKQFGLKGHNGWDFKTKFADTPKGHRYIYASWLMQFYRQGVDPSGYGNFFETVCTLKSIWKLTYAHCLSIENFTTKKEGETMAVSDNTGFSTGSHLHLTVKRIKIINGQHEVLNYNNGYFGAVNPQEYFDEVREFKNNNTKPSLPNNIDMTIDDKTFAHLVEGATVRKELATWLGFDDPDNANLDRFKSHISGLKSRITDLENQIKDRDKKIAELTQEVENQKDKLANLTANCQLDKDALNAKIDSLNKMLKAQSDIEASYMGTISTLEGRLREKEKEVGELKKELEILKATNPQPNNLSVAITELINAIANLFKK